MDYDLSVVIPTYKEAPNIEVLIPQIEEVFKALELKGEIVIVDDNSGDGIEAVVQNFNETYQNINLVVRTDQRGLASAWLDGMAASRGTRIVIMDADLCHDPKYLGPMLERLQDADMVIGSRYMDGKEAPMEGKSFLATYLSKLGQTLVRKALGLTLTDMSHSFRMFHREVFLAVKDELVCDGNVMMMEFLYKSILKGFRVSEIPIRYGERKFGNTKLNVFTQGLKFLKALFYMRFIYKGDVAR